MSEGVGLYMDIRAIWERQGLLHYQWIFQNTNISQPEVSSPVGFQIQFGIQLRRQLAYLLMLYRVVNLYLIFHSLDRSYP